jgi:imidazolonepropionase-like amidohydrolase
MVKRRLVAVGIAVLAAWSAVAEQPQTVPLVIRDATVIDCSGRPPRSGMSILIIDGQIREIAPSSRLRTPGNAQVLDAHGKYLIPGLWNMHVHLGAYADGKPALADYLAEGVTGVRDMGSPLEDILKLRKETAEGTIVGPDLVVAGPIVQGPLPFKMPVFISVKDPSAARQTVDTLRSSGVDFIKVQDAIPHDIYLAVAEQSRRDGLPFVGHIPPTVLPEEASDLGQHSIEHLNGRFWGLLVGSSKDESALHAEELQMYDDILNALNRHSPPPLANMQAAFTKRLVESYDENKASSLMSRFKKNDTWQCPTLVVLPTLWAGNAQYSPEDLLWADRLITKNAAFIPLMQKSGIGLLAGTDLPPNAKGGTIHDELAALVVAGLTPMQALQTATTQPARFLERSNSLGTIEVGKIADLVLLDADPLDDIHNTARISAVILHGHIVSSARNSFAPL